VRIGAEVIRTGKPRGPYGYARGDAEPLPSGLVLAERLALAVARADLARGGPVHDGITAVLVMTVDRLLGGPGPAARLDKSRPYAFTRAGLIEALRRREPAAHRGGPAVVLAGDAALEALAGSIIKPLAGPAGYEIPPAAPGPEAGTGPATAQVGMAPGPHRVRPLRTTGIQLGPARLAGDDPWFRLPRAAALCGHPRGACSQVTPSRPAARW
jgi:hypothetical protein